MLVILFIIIATIFGVIVAIQLSRRKSTSEVLKRAVLIGILVPVIVIILFYIIMMFGVGPAMRNPSFGLK